VLTFRAGFVVLALVVVALDVGFWFFARGPHPVTARIGFLVAFVLLLALLAAAAGVVRWEVAVPLGAASTSGLLFVGAAAIFSVGLGFLLAAVVSRFAPEQENELIRMLQTSRSAVYIIAFIATFTAPFVEEVVYRGVLYSAFQKRIGVLGGFLVATLLFAAVHIPQYWPSYSTLFLLLFLSVILTGIRVWTRNLWPCIVLHTLFNATQSLSLIFAPDQAPKTDLPEQVTAILRLFHL